MFNRMSLKNLKLGTTLWITGIHIGAALLGYIAFSYEGLVLCFFLANLTGWGITAGFHRLFTHGAYEVPRWLYLTLALTGTLAGEGSAIQWVATHRKHHKFSDKDEDPHSPNDGFWWSHILWLFPKLSPGEREAIQRAYAPDLSKDPALVFLDKKFIHCHLALAAILFALGYMYGGMFMGFSFFVWGTLVRMVIVFNVTWSVNSCTHVWGYRNFDTRDKSTNLWWVAALGGGEGWHNNHHAFAKTANHGHRWYEFDPTYWTIRTFAFLGLAWNLRYYDASSKKIYIIAPRNRKNSSASPPSEQDENQLEPVPEHAQ